MKIGILTFHNIPNFGALLQAFALCKALRQMEYECEIIDYKCESVSKKELTYQKHPNKFKDILIKNLIWPSTEKKIRSCYDFMSQSGMYSKEHYERSTIMNANKHYDVFLSGSDMIWDFGVTDRDTTFMLDFANDEKIKYSYGSSCGDEIWKASDLERVQHLLGRYKGLGVREESMRIKLQGIGLESKLVADPTMLLNSDQWNEIAVTPKIKNYVLVYFPSEKNLKAASKYAAERGLKVAVLNWGLPMFKYKNIAPYRPQEWVGYVKNAEAVFTDSYHGFLFALYFKKPVWVGKKGNRFNSMYDYLGIGGVDLDIDCQLCYEIDYSQVISLLKAMREDSLNYLRGIG